MTVLAHIVGDAPVPLWGLPTRERLRRLLGRAGVTDVRAVLGPTGASSADSVVVARGDHVYDDRVIWQLVRRPGVALAVRDGRGLEIVAAHVPWDLAPAARDALSGAGDVHALAGLAVETPDTLAPAYRKELRSSAPPFVARVTSANRYQIEERLFAGAYKSVTDLLTKWVWPSPALRATRLAVRLGLAPNHVTAIGVGLVVLAGALFALGLHGWGLLAAFLMTFLDTVDGKLARVTVTSSRFGHVLDHGTDLIHPPLWYLAWGWGLTSFDPGLPGLSLAGVEWLIVVGYVLGRGVEGAFHLWLGRFSIFSWRPLDSYFRLVTARRNPNLLLLTGATLIGRPDLGLVAVAGWTVVSTVFLLARLAVAWRVKRAEGPLRSWLVDPEAHGGPGSLAVRVFARAPAGGHGA
jgi:phosphatidylglycerophosphate synthase